MIQLRHTNDKMRQRMCNILRRIFASVFSYGKTPRKWQEKFCILYKRSIDRSILSWYI